MEKQKIKVEIVGIKKARKQLKKLKKEVIKTTESIERFLEVKDSLFTLNKSR